MELDFSDQNELLLLSLSACMIAQLALEDCVICSEMLLQ